MQTIEVDFGDGRRFALQVPREASDAEIEAEIDLLDARTKPPVDPTAQMSGLERFTAGVGRGMVNVARQLGNIAGLVPDESIEQARALEEPLMRTGAGQVGSFVGELATTAPLAGGLVGAGARTLGAVAPQMAAKAALTPVRAGLARGAAEGTIEGAILAGPEGRGEGAALGATLGGVGGAALPLIARGFRRPGEGSQVLSGMGVDLTPGQMVPGGAWNQLEQAMTSYPIVGPAITASRKRAQQQFAEQMIQEGRPPGAKPVTTGNLEEMLDDVYRQYDNAYGQFKGIDLPGNVTDDLETGFLNATMDPEIAADAQTRSTILDYLANQLTRIEDRAVPKSEDLLSLRSKIRKQIARKKKQGDWDAADMLERAERAITDTIDQVLPPDAASRLRRVDAQYGKYKIAEDAMYRAGDRGDPTSFQWQQAVRKATTSPGAYARGGGTLREPVRAAREAFETTSAPTGQRLATLLPLAAAGGSGLGYMGVGDPFAAGYIGLPLALLAGTKSGRRLSMGQTRAQQALQRFGQLPMANLAPMLLRGAAPVAATGE